MGRARAWVGEDAGLERGSYSRCGLFLPEERPSPLVGEEKWEDPERNPVLKSGCLWGLWRWGSPRTTRTGCGHEQGRGRVGEGYRRPCVGGAFIGQWKHL